MKKIFAFIFSFYFLALTCLPCNDKDDCKNQMEVSNSSFAINDHSNHENDTENCPPFCICACCTQTCNFEYHTYHIPFIQATIEKNFSVYAAPLHSEVHLNIWQPPKV